VAVTYLAAGETDTELASAITGLDGGSGDGGSHGGEGGDRLELHFERIEGCCCKIMFFVQDVFEC
jgi:hypothetical protein